MQLDLFFYKVVSLVISISQSILARLIRVNFWYIMGIGQGVLAKWQRYTFISLVLVRLYQLNDKGLTPVSHWYYLKCTD